MVEIIIIVCLAVWHVTSTCVDIRFSREFISVSLINTYFPPARWEKGGCFTLVSSDE